MRCLTLLIATLATLGAAGAAQAQKMRPGLWENSITMKASGGEMEASMARMQQEMARMSPEQRRQMEAMMGGKGMGMAAGKPTTARVCVTPEQAARNEMPADDGRCKQTSFTRSGNVVRYKFTCDSPEMKGSGEGELTMVSDTEHRGRTHVTAQRNGKTERIEMQHAGRWVAADCGAVKPLR